MKHRERKSFLQKASKETKEGKNVMGTQEKKGGISTQEEQRPQRKVSKNAAGKENAKTQRRRDAKRRRNALIRCTTTEHEIQ